MLWDSDISLLIQKTGNETEQKDDYESGLEAIIILYAHCFIITGLWSGIW